jgi:hypothetical protein
MIEIRILKSDELINESSNDSQKPDSGATIPRSIGKIP